jgi:type IV pilus assembly protein PilM
MSWLGAIKRLVKDPPPEFVFELSEAGLAWARTATPADVRWRRLDPGIIQVSPLRDNVLRAEALHNAIESVAPQTGKGRTRRTAVILPDYCARIGVLDFDTFPQERAEQLALVRFRLKRGLAFDVDSAVLSWHIQPKAPGATKVDVIAAAIPAEVAARYEAPFRAAGYHPGFVTLSALAALALAGQGEPNDASAPGLAVKLSGRVLALSVMSGSAVKMYRCVELSDLTEGELWDVLLPTFAYMEDQLAERPRYIRVCGFPALSAEAVERWSRELGAPVIEAFSRFGKPGPFDAGLYGYLEALEAA